MSKERAARLALIRETLDEPEEKGESPRERERREKTNAVKNAALDLAADFLAQWAKMAESQERIAKAVEKIAEGPVLSPLGKGEVVGKLARFEPAVAPEMVERLVAAVEKLADVG